DLIVVGDGPYKQEMASLLSRSRAFFTGELTGENLARAYASSDLFVFPSTTDTFGNVVLEAQASGLPVVVSNQGGPQENLIAGKTGFVVPAFAPEAIAAVISRLYHNTAETARMKQAARKYMEGRCFEENFLKTWNLFQNVSGFVDPNMHVEDLISAAG
ncbi:MAG: glycosyltransferase, partial [Thermodesulfobacteriota bacterium]